MYSDNKLFSITDSASLASIFSSTKILTEPSGRYEKTYGKRELLSTIKAYSAVTTYLLRLHSHLALALLTPIQDRAPKPQE